MVVLGDVSVSGLIGFRVFRDWDRDWSGCMDGVFVYRGGDY